MSARSSKIERALIIFTFAAAIGSSVVAGMFFAFSSFVLPALGRVEPQTGIAVMNAINVTVYNAGFMFVFMGTAAACVMIALFSYAWWDRLDGKLLLFAALAYLILCVAVTSLFNVPLNNALAAAEPGSQQQAVLWDRILNEWTFWNHFRMAAALVSAITLAVALLRHDGI